MPQQISIWIPKDLYSGLETMDIASTMIQDFGVSQINNDTYNDNFNEYYDRNIRENETNMYSASFLRRFAIYLQKLLKTNLLWTVQYSTNITSAGPLSSS